MRSNVTMGCEPGPSTSARTRTWAPVNVRPPDTLRWAGNKDAPTRDDIVVVLFVCNANSTNDTVRYDVRRSNTYHRTHKVPTCLFSTQVVSTTHREISGHLGMDRFVIQCDTPRPIPDAVLDPGEAEREVRRAAAADKAKELGLAWPAQRWMGFGRRSREDWRRHELHSKLEAYVACDHGVALEALFRSVTGELHAPHAEEV